MLEFREAVAEMETEKCSIPPRLPIDSSFIHAYKSFKHRILILGRTICVRVVFFY